ncbi:uncharacterized protein G2W53_029298 [Senna tora]|uniref:Uncharacterized protein n=1 Tax=Senna tora TaxID=362788 RepID=A0A834WFL6_9FABA|nr:uncharacterized protein G2W53_029298 [Senna tora]
MTNMPFYMRRKREREGVRE